MGKEKSIEITRSCCAGNELFPGHCLRNECPLYRSVADYVNSSWPYGNPTHTLYLAKVRSIIRRAKSEGGGTK